MLTKSHYAAQKLVRCSDKPAYRKHMCGLCHALGDDYGLPYRLLTNHDTILLNLLTSAQCPDDPKTVMRRCPLNPARFVKTNQNTGSQFAAAVTVGLAAISVDDDMEDSGGRNLIARMARVMLNQPEQVAFKQLNALGFDIHTLKSLGANQSAAEANIEANPAAPSAAVGAALFTMTAKLAGTPENTPALAAAGAHYGTYIYLADAYRDLEQDIKNGDFNPLRVFTDDAATLSDAGKTWLNEQIHEALDGIRAAVKDLTLHRDRATVVYLLTQPLKQLLGTGHTPVCRTCAVHYEPTNEEEKPKRKRKNSDKAKHSSKSESCCCDVGYCYCDADCCDCCDCCDCDCGDGCCCDGCSCD